MSFMLLADNWSRLHLNQAVANASSAPTQTTSTLPSATPNTLPAANLVNPANTSTGAIAKLIEIDMPLYKVYVNTQGASIETLTLKKYSQSLNNQTPVHIFDTKQQYSARSGVVNGPNHQHIFELIGAQQTQFKLDPSNNNKEFKLTLKGVSNNLELTKTLVFKADSYVIDVQNAVKNLSNAPMQTELYAELVRDHSLGEQSKFYSTFTGPAVYTAEQKFQKITFDDLSAQKASFANQANNGFVAMVQHYFTSSWFLNEAKTRSFYAENLNSNLSRVGFKLPLASINPSQSVTQNMQLFAGPQEEFKLEKITPGLELVKDYGWATMLAKPLFWLLSYLHDLLGNWGWAIIALTFLIKTFFYPLTASSQRSMSAIKDLQPKVLEMRERYKSEPQKLQQEMIKIYKDAKVNPLGGCLPILIQTPVFFALYYVLLSSVEMRQAPWLGWIQDLSIADPYYILPVLMAVSMWLQMQLAPKPADPTQAKIMMVMPVVFSVIFFFFPAGLVLYYVVNNLLTIAQQKYIERGIDKKNVLAKQMRADKVVNHKSVANQKQSGK